MEEKINTILDELKTLNKVLLGNGTPENAVCYRLARIEENFGKHMEDCSINGRDGKRERRTDINNRPKWQKYTLWIALASLVLGNLATIGYVIANIGKWLSNIP